jgi:hypothetical protein
MSRRPDRFPMLTVAAVLGAPLDFEAMRTRSIAVAAAGTAGTAIMDHELDLAKRARGLDHRCDSEFCLPTQRRGQSLIVSRASARAPLPVTFVRATFKRSSVSA